MRMSYYSFFSPETKILLKSRKFFFYYKSLFTFKLFLGLISVYLHLFMHIILDVFLFYKYPSTLYIIILLFVKTFWTFSNSIDIIRKMSGQVDPDPTSNSLDHLITPYRCVCVDPFTHGRFKI